MKMVKIKNTFAYTYIKRLNTKYSQDDIEIMYIRYLNEFEEMNNYFRCQFLPFMQETQTTEYLLLNYCTFTN